MLWMQKTKRWIAGAIAQDVFTSRQIDYQYFLAPTILTVESNTNTWNWNYSTFRAVSLSKCLQTFAILHFGKYTNKNWRNEILGRELFLKRGNKFDVVKLFSAIYSYIWSSRRGTTIGSLYKYSMFMSFRKLCSIRQGPGNKERCYNAPCFQDLGIRYIV